MSDYQHILVGIDLSEEAKHVAHKAASLAKSFGARLSMMHVIEPLSFAYGGDIPMDLSSVQDEIQQQANDQLGSLAKAYGVAEDDQHITLGRAEIEIHRFAEQQGIDLIVVGSHGRRGLALLLGSTANGVLHGASCDVLAVRVQ
ncbi:MAG: universal stress protein [Pseudomonadales bacterium]